MRGFEVVGFEVGVFEVEFKWELRCASGGFYVRVFRCVLDVFYMFLGAFGS